MNNIAPVILIAAAGGIAVALQAQFMGLMNRSLGTFESVLITYGSGGTLIILILLLRRGGNFENLSSVPWYAFTTGAIGLIIVGSIGYAVPRIGLVQTMVVLIAAQFVLSSFVDHFGLW